MSKFRSLPAYQRWLLITLVSLAVLYLIVQTIVSLFLDPYVGKKLKTRFHESTRETYVLEFEDLDLNIIGREFSLDNVSIRPDSSNLDNEQLWSKMPVRGQFQADNFSIQGVGILDMIFEKKLHIKSIGLRNPDILLESIKSKQKADTSSSRQSLNMRAYKAINTYLKSLSIDHFGITGTSLNVRKSDKNQDFITLKDGMLQLRDILIDSASAQREQFFITDKIEWNTGKISWNLSKNLYTLKALATGGSSFDRTAYIDSLRLEPLYPRYEFSKTVGQEIDRIDLNIGRLALQEFNYDSLLLGQKLIANTLHLGNTKLDIFRDKRLPGGPTTVKPLPHLTFQEFQFPVKLDTISISDAHIAYSEHKPQVTNPGTITFEELQATFSNVTNIASGSEKKEPITLEAQTKVMGTGLLRANFSFFASDTSGRHNIYGTLDSMAVKDLNPILENVGFVHADDGFINSLKFSMELNKRIATGTLTLNYRDLKIKMLEQDKVKEGETKEITSFIANTFVIKKNNTEKPLRNGRIEFERIEEKSVFNYWWKSLLSGLKNNIGL